MIDNDSGKWDVTPKQRNALYDLNQVLKNMYSSYICDEDIIMPSMEEDIKRHVYKHCLIKKSYDYEFMVNSLVNIDTLSKAIKGICLDMTLDSHNIYHLKNYSKDLDFAIAKKLPKDKVQELRKNSDIINDMIATVDTLTSGTWYSIELDEESIISLQDYSVLEKEIAPGVVMVLTKELFPAIKKAHTMRIHSKPMCEEYGIHEVIIESAHDDWTVYTKHHIVVY